MATKGGADRCLHMAVPCVKTLSPSSTHSQPHHPNDAITAPKKHEHDYESNSQALGGRSSLLSPPLRWPMATHCFNPSVTNCGASLVKWSRVWRKNTDRRLQLYGEIASRTSLAGARVDSLPACFSLPLVLIHQNFIRATKNICH